MLKRGAKNYFDQVQKVPYAVIGDQWVGYDDVTSFVLKVSSIIFLSYILKITFDD